jgi:hypothetical protein
MFGRDRWGWCLGPATDNLEKWWRVLLVEAHRPCKERTCGWWLAKDCVWYWSWICVERRQIRSTRVEAVGEEPHSVDILCCGEYEERTFRRQMYLRGKARPYGCCSIGLELPMSL